MLIILLRSMTFHLIFILFMSINHKNDYVTGICDSGGEVYVVGGAIRNFLYNYFHETNKKIKDFDFLVRLLNANQLEDVLIKYGMVKEVGKSFGIILFVPHDAHNPNTFIEFALPRIE